MQCLCRTCKKRYDSNKARGDWMGFCSAKCQHTKAKELGHKKGQSEFDILNRANCIGSVPTPEEKARIQGELLELRANSRANPNRIAELQRLLKATV